LVVAFAVELSGEGWVGPAVVCCCDHVVVRHQHSWCRSIHPMPPIQQGVPVDNLAVENTMHPWIQVGENVDEPVEVMPFGGALVGARHRWNAEEGSESVQRCLDGHGSTLEDD
jgi:hypothetical protein